MNPASRRPDRRCDIFEERDDIMIRALLDLEDFRNRKPRFLSNLVGILFGNLAELGHCFASKQFDLQPDLIFALIRPDLAHLGTGITIDHPAKIDCPAERESVLSRKKKSLRQNNPPERFEKFASIKLANFGAEEPAVALEANFSAAEKISHRRDRLLRIGGARTNGENQIAERKFGSGL